MDYRQYQATPAAASTARAHTPYCRAISQSCSPCSKEASARAHTTHHEKLVTSQL